MVVSLSNLAFSDFYKAATVKAVKCKHRIILYEKTAPICINALGAVLFIGEMRLDRYTFVKGFPMRFKYYGISSFFKFV